MLKGKFVELKETESIFGKFKLFESYDFLMVKFSGLSILYVIFLKTDTAMHTAITLKREWSAVNIRGYYAFRNIITEGNKKETIKAIREVWGDVEVEEDSVVIQTPKE